MLNKEELINNKFKLVSDYSIFIFSPDVDKYFCDSEQLKLVDYGSKTTSKQLIIDILSNNHWYNTIKKLYNNTFSAVPIFFIDDNGQTIDKFSFTKMSFVNLLNQINVNDYPCILPQYNEIMNSVSFETYKKQNIDFIYEVNIDCNDYKIEFKNMIFLLELSDYDFDTLIKSNPETIFGMPFNYFVYAINKFFTDNKLVENYIIDDKIIERLKIISSSKYIDIEMLNEYLTTNDSLLSKFMVNPDLENEILRDLPIYFTDEEKAIYIYIKMCKILTYDEEFYAVDQKGALASKHKNLDNIRNINLDNNKIVCYEFNAIYSYMLNKLNINYKNFVASINGIGQLLENEFDDKYYKYGEMHAFLKFRVGKYLIKADPVITILQSDLVQAKLNQKLKGFKCVNINKNSRNEFNDIIQRVYEFIAEKEPKISNNKVGEKESFDDILSEFMSKTDKFKSMDIKEKVDILIQKINYSKLIGIDAYSYLLQLSRILFTTQERKDNIKITVIKVLESPSCASAAALISVKYPNDEEQMQVSIFIYRPGSKLKDITIQEFEERLDQGIFKSDISSHAIVHKINN